MKMNIASDATIRISPVTILSVSLRRGNHFVMSGVPSTTTAQLRLVIVPYKTAPWSPKTRLMLIGIKNPNCEYTNDASAEQIRNKISTGLWKMTDSADCPSFASFS